MASTNPINRAIQTIEDNSDLVPVSNVEDPELQALFAFMPPELKENYTLTKAQLTKLRQQGQQLKHGILTKSAMMCHGPRCPMAEGCVFLEANQAPVGHPCPYEMRFMEVMTNSIINELEIDPNNAIEMCMLADLVQAELMDIRATNEISKYGFIEEQPVAINQAGETIMRKELSVAFNAQDTLKNRKMRLRDKFLATRESKAKHATKAAMNPSKFAATLINKLEQAVVREEKRKSIEAGEPVDERH